MDASHPTRPGLTSCGPIASVRRDWRDGRLAHVPLVDLTDLHWDHVAGDADARPPGPILHGFTRCDAIVAGELPHVAVGGPHPHTVKVCILREDNDRLVFERLSLQAGPKPREPGTGSSGHTPGNRE
jgi:hypothetical protein